MFRPGWSTPGVSKAASGSLVKPAGWSPSVADMLEFVRKWQTITGTCGVIPEGRATCEGLARTVKELWDRPQIPGNEDGKVMTIAIVV